MTRMFPTTKIPLKHFSWQNRPCTSEYEDKSLNWKSSHGESFPNSNIFHATASHVERGGRALVVAVSCYKATSPPLPPQLVLNTSVVHTIQHEVPGENL